jgi:hypothetical protein
VQRTQGFDSEYPIEVRLIKLTPDKNRLLRKNEFADLKGLELKI